MPQINDWKSKISVVSFILFGLLALFAVERTIHSLTDGFTISRITPEKNKLQLIPSEAETPPDLQKIFDQKFHYMNCGSEVYVFQSEDQNYVLKFIKQHRYQMPLFFNLLPLPKSLKKIRNTRQTKKNQALLRIQQSCVLSSTVFKEDTGVIYTHIEPTDHLKSVVKIIDRSHIEHSINLDKAQFVLQRKAESTAGKFLKFRSNEEHEKAKQAFDELLSLSEKRSLLGYYDKDPDLINNFGFIGTKPIEIDTAGFSPYSHKDPRRFYYKEIHKIKGKALPWFEKNYPEIADYVNVQLNSLIET
ncbi:MAG: hypothetical protein WDZ28_05455 [Simkaniaceae bacterium]